MFPVPRPSLFAYIISSCRSRAARISALSPGLYKNQRWGNIPVHRRTLAFASPKSLWHGCLGERRELGLLRLAVNKPTFLSVWVVSQIRPGFSQFVPPLLYRFQRSGATCVIGIPALFRVTGDTQVCNQGLKADGVNHQRQGIPLCCAFGGFELASSCYKLSLAGSRYVLIA